MSCNNIRQCHDAMARFYSPEAVKERKEKAEKVFQEVIKHLPEGVPADALRAWWEAGRITVIAPLSVDQLREVWVDYGAIHEGQLFSYNIDGSPIRELITGPKKYGNE